MGDLRGRALHADLRHRSRSRASRPGCAPRGKSSTRTTRPTRMSICSKSSIGGHRAGSLADERYSPRARGVLAGHGCGLRLLGRWTPLRRAAWSARSADARRRSSSARRRRLLLACPRRLRPPPAAEASWSSRPRPRPWPAVSSTGGAGAGCGSAGGSRPARSAGASSGLAGGSSAARRAASRPPAARRRRSRRPSAVARRQPRRGRRPGCARAGSPSSPRRRRR